MAIKAEGMMFTEDEVRCLCGTLREEIEYLAEQPRSAETDMKIDYYLEAVASIEQTWAIIFATKEERQMLQDAVIDTITCLREYPCKEEEAEFTAHIIHVCEGVLKKISK